MTLLLHHRAEGPADAPVLILGPSLGTSLSLWDRQVPALARTHRVIRWDLPGHGGSPAELLPAGATIAELGSQVIALADALGAASFAYAGVSLGGAVGSWLAAHHPQRVTSLSLLCTSARFGEPEPWRQRAQAVRADGIAALAAGAPDRWFTPGFAASGNRAVADLVADHETVDPEGYAACCEVIAGLDLRADLARITAPTLVIGGRDDAATPPAHARALADGIADAHLVEIARAGHLACVERPQAVLTALRAHLAADGLGEFGAPGEPDESAVSDETSESALGRDVGTQEPDGSDGFSRATAMAVRRAVLGDAHVDRAVARTTAFTARFQDFITRYAWGEIWTSDVLDRRTRSCITLTALVAGGHEQELAMHVRAALRNGLSPTQIGEVLLQTAVYCGVPAANSAFAVADRVLSEHHGPGDHAPPAGPRPAGPAESDAESFGGDKENH
ncbi:bifunctional 3-oxoadipate enol-lactonase/4-carboxymuconolactone decarboxylase PcaDC [Streptomyces zagrosensis]|uniref:3-oxoadipate enol-lactonase/4-carboxymuconolactone decarboxylase n=1 Tax=Streptomyces zagrosensis TaxID=1042984 RepID=A0A7W9QEC7_9ACTN|nr:3-oxoadipate enol-lactonase [Streptomyces zagrosensis]MBB5938690.1 3-oxoadipate enol-lactonase/4-carboxymuconolactone decarboxylase [Streptomyces zagrosensis]